MDAVFDGNNPAMNVSPMLIKIKIIAGPNSSTAFNVTMPVSENRIALIIKILL